MDVRVLEAGVVGVDASDEQQARVEELASALAGTGSEKAQSRVPLQGTYDLLYSMSKGGSNGKVGPFVGSVTQIIVDETNFINQVELLGGVPPGVGQDRLLPAGVALQIRRHVQHLPIHHQCTENQPKLGKEYARCAFPGAH